MLVGTWNLENLMLPRSGDGAPATEAEYEAKVEALASVITALDPALLGVQEVRQEEALADLAKAAGGQWHTALSRYADRRGIRVGVLSRTPLRIRRDTHVFAKGLRPVQGDDGTEPDPHDHETSRGFLAVETDTGDGLLQVAVAHLKSKLLSYPAAEGKSRFQPHDEAERARFGAYALYRRAAEATTLRAVADFLLEGAGTERDVIVLGDMNDVVNAATTQILLGPPGSELDKPRAFHKSDLGDPFRLWDIAPCIPEERRFSRVSFGRAELIDHVLLSHRLAKRIAEAGTGLPEHRDDALVLPSVSEDPRKRVGTPGSDHAPVWVRV
ncbi:endonuclease/exonuclease/phosphatase family metal-dependent hydrolase [Streptomyces sp. SAI-208]|uniref:endonuclease/exonuclease/phosphatase family protein n=1 Tax=Streptomyces sp. SAI-208 TaxID=2940550 RepID=UPI0024731874|nr:endonuclease/exonuclease/phosphatase family protein [Streptomyces sp. SAI-208]MDH6610788.1 endonuclease/exonuclease/phosphatase family metal-dependent hydrolase [Streptomyces sp. SAI-208]